MAMASLSSLPHSLHSSPSTSSANYVIPSKPPCPKRLRFGSSNRRHTKSFAPRAAVDEVSVLEPPPPQPPSSGSKTTPNPELVASLKLNLLSAVSGLNRGLAASGEDLQKAEAAAKEIEAAGGPVDLSTDLDKLQGRWKLIYSSAFSSRTLGGSRPGPPTGRLLPITLGQCPASMKTFSLVRKKPCRIESHRLIQKLHAEKYRGSTLSKPYCINVFQRIDIFSKDFDNIVELELGAPWPLPPVEATATLAHKFELIGSSRVKIIFEKTTVKTTGNLSQLPPLELPKLPEGLRPPSNPGSGEFDVTYLDADIRITRGDRDELRVFVVS